jgi:hypothetical protein
MQKLTEISLVDNPACPTAQFEHREVGRRRARRHAAGGAEDAPKVAIIGPAKSVLVAKLGRLAASSEQIGLDVTKRAEPYDVQQALQCIAFLESLVANEMFEAEYADVVGDRGRRDPESRRSPTCARPRNS